MKRFILNIIIFIFIFVFLDRMGGFLLQNQRPTDYQLFLDAKKEFFQTDEEFDVLLVGDSHIADAIDPRIIEEKTSYSAYNLGIYHSSPFENYYVTKAALVKLEHKPKIIVLGTNPKMFERKLSKGKYTPLILPSTFELVRNSEEGFDPGYFLKTIKEKYLFKALLNKLTKNNYQPTRVIEDVDNGYLKFRNQMPDIEWHTFERSKPSRLNKEQLEYFEKTISLILQHNISVIIVNPPIWNEHFDAMKSTKSFKDFEEKLEEIARKYKIKTYNDYLNVEDSIDSLNLRQSDFLNTQHLNYSGSQKFTNGFCDFFKAKGF